MGNIVKGIVVHWLLNQLANAANGVNWDNVKTEVKAKIDAAVPSQFLDKPLNDIVDEVVDAVAAAAQDQADLDALVNDCASANWAKALVDLEALLGKVASPTPVQAKLLQLLKAA